MKQRLEVSLYLNESDLITIHRVGDNVIVRQGDYHMGTLRFPQAIGVPSVIVPLLTIELSEGYLPPKTIKDCIEEYELTLKENKKDKE